MSWVLAVTPEDRIWLALAVRGGDGPATRGPDCLDDDLIAALADGSLDPAERTAVVPHVSGCAWCRQAVSAVARALDDREVAAAVADLERDGRARWWRIGRVALPLAAASVIVLLAWPRPAPDDAGLHRAPTITASPSAVPLAPIGPVADGRRLMWTSVTGADLYRVTVFDRQGSVLYEARLTDTAVVIPDSVVVSPSRRYLWKVEARTGIGRWTASDLVEFSIPGGGR